ncbi:GIP [Symbiodinium sp. CCMP2592]|nr:GIP [Symbiodinium sp. CCMP2592]
MSLSAVTRVVLATLLVSCCAMRNEQEEKDSRSVAASEPPTDILTHEEHLPGGTLTMQYSNTFRYQDTQQKRSVLVAIYACAAGVARAELAECIANKNQEHLGASFHVLIHEGYAGPVVGHSKGFALGFAMANYKNASFLLWEDSA